MLFQSWWLWQEWVWKGGREVGGKGVGMCSRGEWWKIVLPERKTVQNNSLSSDDKARSSVEIPPAHVLVCRYCSTRLTFSFLLSLLVSKATVLVNI